MARITVPPTPEAMAKLTDDELHKLASAVVAEQHRRSGIDGLERTAKARRALQSLTPEQRKAQTAAATEARRLARLAAKNN